MSLKLSKKTGKILLLVIVYKTLLEVSCYKVLFLDYNYFTDVSFNVIKYFVGFAWCLLSFLLLDLENKRASSFFLFLIYVLQIIPISAIYCLKEPSSSVYYNFLLASFVLCELIVLSAQRRFSVRLGEETSGYLFPLFTIAAVIIMAVIVIQNGLPTLTAMDIYSVYDLRENNPFHTSKYVGYLLVCIGMVVLPVMTARLLLKKKYLLSLFPIAAMIMIYLYTGQKTYLFSIPLVMAVVFFLNRKNGEFKLYAWMLIAYSVICVLACILPGKNTPIIKLYSAVVRRVLFVPASLKFIHFDYFTNHPHLGLYGAIPKAINPFVPSYYNENGISPPFEIGRIYFDAPNMSADTGVLIEGYARFGLLGLVGSLVFLALIIIQMDFFQNKTSYRTTVCYFAFAFYSLAEQQIVGTLILGTWMFILLIIILYKEKKEDQPLRDHPRAGFPKRQRIVFRR